MVLNLEKKLDEESIPTAVDTLLPLQLPTCQLTRCAIRGRFIFNSYSKRSNSHFGVVFNPHPSLIIFSCKILCIRSVEMPTMSAISRIFIRRSSTTRKWIFPNIPLVAPFELHLLFLNSLIQK